MPASPVASSVASPGTSQSGSRGGSQSPRDLGTGDSDAMTDDANEPPDDADARNAGRRAAADGALADFGTRDTALVTQSTVDSTASDDEEQQTTDQAAAAEPTPSDEPPAPKPATADAADERPARRRPAREAPRAAAPAAKRHGLSLVLWLAVAGGLAFAAWKYWPDMSGSQRTKSSGPTATPNSPTKSGNDSGGGASGSSGEPTNGKTDDRRPPVVHTKESLRLQFAPADSRVTIDGVAAALDASGALQLERLPNEPIAIAARRDGFRDFAATKTLAEWRAAGGAIRLEPLPVDYAAQGRDLLAKGRTPQAIEFLEQAIAAGHGSPPVYHALGLARQQLGDDPSAVDAFSKAIADDAGLADAFRARAASYRTMKKWTEAIADLERYVELAPAKIALVADDRVDALAGRIYESLAANRVDEALRDTAAAIDVAAERPRAKVTALLARGAVRRQSGRLDDAVDDFRAAVKLDADLARRVKPALAEALLVRGNLRNETAQQTLAQAKSPPTPEVLKLFDPAIADLTESITLAPGDEAYSARGFAYNARGEFEKAVADFSEALKSNPTSVLALNNRGYAYFLLKEYKEAVDDLSAAIRLTMTDNPLAYSNRGAAYYQLREYDKAVSDYTEALRQSREPSPQLKIGLAQAFYARGEGFAKSGNFDSALGDFQKALEHAADAPKLLAELRQREADTLSRLATARVQQGRVGDALDLAQQYVTRYSKVADAYATRGYVHSARREFKKSIADYDKAIEIDRKNPKHYYYRGLVNAAAGDNAAAIDDYTAAITLDANLAEAYIRRAAAYDLRKSPGDAARSAADRRKAALLATPIPPVAPPAP